MVLIADCVDWLPDQPWDQAWSQPVDYLVGCWFPPPPIACEWSPIAELANDTTPVDSGVIDLGDGGSDSAFWAVGEAGGTDPITGSEAENYWEPHPVDAGSDDMANVEIPPFDSGEALNGTEFTGKPFQIYTKPYFPIYTKPYFPSSEEIFSFLEAQPGDTAVEGEETYHDLIEPGAELICVDWDTCELVDDAAAENFNDGSEPSLDSEPLAENAFPDDPVEQVEAPGDEDIDAYDPSATDLFTGFGLTASEGWTASWYHLSSGEMLCGINDFFFNSYYTIDHASGENGDDYGLTSTDTGSSLFIQDYPIKHARPVTKRAGIHEEDDISELVPTLDPTVLRGNGEDPTTYQAVPSEDFTYSSYLKFLEENSQWAGDHGAGGIQLQVITPSAYLPWIELSTPGAAWAFDAWYEQTQLTQTPPEDQPIDPAADSEDPLDPWKREFTSTIRSLNLFQEAFSSTSPSTDTAVIDLDAEVTTLPFSAVTMTQAVLARELPQVASAGRATIEPFEISLQQLNLLADDPASIALRPTPAVASSPAAFYGDEASAAFAATGDSVLAREEAELLLEQLSLTAMPWWLLRPIRR